MSLMCANMSGTEHCNKPVTHIDEKGFIYCAECGKERSYYRRCRRMRKWEIKLLLLDQPLPSYKPISKAAAMARLANAEVL